MKIFFGIDLMLVHLNKTLNNWLIKDLYKITPLFSKAFFNRVDNL